MIRLALLASGRGSNFLAIQKAIEEGRLDAEIVLLLSDRETAPALEKAISLGIPARYIPYKKEDRESFERAAADEVEAAKADLVILAGFMRMLTPYIIHRFPRRILNIHPSLLPSFRGLHAQRQALEYGVKIAGCTVHVVTEELDAGPIVGQRCVEVFPDDSEESLSNRILEQEHQLYPEAIAEHARSL